MPSQTILATGPNGKVKPYGFEGAAFALTTKLSEEATRGLLGLVQDVAGKYHYDDSRMLRMFTKRLKTLARRTSWAGEVIVALTQGQREREGEGLPA